MFTLLDMRQSVKVIAGRVAVTRRVAKVREDELTVSWKTRSVTAGASLGTKFMRVA